MWPGIQEKIVDNHWTRFRTTGKEHAKIRKLFSLRISSLSTTHKDWRRARVFDGDFLFAMRLSLRSNGKWCRRFYSSPLTDGDGDADGYIALVVHSRRWRNQNRVKNGKPPLKSVAFVCALEVYHSFRLRRLLHATEWDEIDVFFLLLGKVKWTTSE